MSKFNPQSVSILGMNVSVFESYDHAATLIHERILAGTQTFCVAINPEKMYMAKRNPKLGEMLRSADIRICDGIGISLASMLLYRRSIPRCTGIDLFMKLICLSEQEGLKIFVLGASPEANHAACNMLVAAHPGLMIVGRHHGYFDEVGTIIDSINESGADLLFVAMGSPRQEFWITEHMPKLHARFCMGIGGSLDVVSGSVQRAPALCRGTGTEWLYRLLSQPSRIRRQAVLPLFAVDVLRSLRHRRALES
jgi:N-acetylglucosaminyldiphosphoundecaprenol N-acetyl-beta-D-mannosaminyltransferase